MSEPQFNAARFVSWRAGNDSTYPETGVEHPPSPPVDDIRFSNAPSNARILTLLHDIGKELTSILDPPTLLRAVGAGVKSLVDYDLLSVMLLNNATQRLENVLSLRYDKRVHSRLTLALGEGLCGAAAKERKPVRVNRVKRDSRYIQCENALGVESELVVPLIVKDRLLGVLDLESLRPDAFTEDHEQMLSILASSLAIALENAYLYDQLRRTEQRIKEDLERAREVQRLLLPKATPKLPGIEIAVHYHPAQELGGDFYDFLHYGDGRVAVAVGDVAGKGPAAALLASLGVGILRDHAVHQRSTPPEMLADLNRHLQTPGSQGRFIAMAFGVYDTARGEFHLANAGFPAPILIRDKRASVIPIGGLPIGILPDSVYESVCLRLRPGDVVVFCSDGIHEQQNALEEEFGVERLIARLTQTCEGSAAEQIAGRIVQAISEHAGDDACRECRDDQTIVVLRITEVKSARSGNGSENLL